MQCIGKPHQRPVEQDFRERQNGWVRGSIPLVSTLCERSGRVTWPFVLFL